MTTNPIAVLDVDEGQELAVDFNISPGLNGTGIEDIVPAKDIVELLKEAVARGVPA